VWKQLIDTYLYNPANHDGMDLLHGICVHLRRFSIISLMTNKNHAKFYLSHSLYIIMILIFIIIKKLNTSLYSFIWTWISTGGYYPMRKWLSSGGNVVKMVYNDHMWRGRAPGMTIGIMLVILLTTNLQGLQPQSGTKNPEVLCHLHGIIRISMVSIMRNWCWEFNSYSD